MNRYPLNTVTLVGWETQYGSGTADVVFALVGAEESHKLGSGTADVTIDVSSTHLLGVAGSGAINIVIDAAGAGQIGVRGDSGPADVVLAVSFGIVPHPARPALVTATHPSRRSIVPPQKLELRVASENRTSRVPPERRTTVVPKERGI